MCMCVVSRQFTRLYEPLPTDITHEPSLAKVNTFRLLSELKSYRNLQGCGRSPVWTRLCLTMAVP